MDLTTGGLRVLALGAHEQRRPAAVLAATPTSIPAGEAEAHRMLYGGPGAAP